MNSLTERKGRTHFHDDPARWPARILASAWNALVAWQSRASRRSHLDALDDRMLRDVGLSRRDIQPEIDKPFWQG